MYILGSFGSEIRIRAFGLLPTLFSRSSFITQDGGASGFVSQPNLAYSL